MSPCFRILPGSYYKQLDLIKLVAIACVILLHSGTNQHIPLGAFTLSQAVPIFMIIAGINSTLSAFKEGTFSLANEYSYRKFTKYFFRIGIPYICIQFYNP